MSKNYSSLPEGFLKDIKLIPHNFNNPENEKHIKFIQEDLKYNLFTFTYLKIKQIEYRKLKNNEDYFRIRKIEKSNCELNFFKNIFRKKFRGDNSELIRCEKWYVNLNNKKDFVYDVDYYHSFNDQFFSLIFPGNYFDFFLGLWKNKGL